MPAIHRIHDADDFRVTANGIGIDSITTLYQLSFFEKDDEIDYLKFQHIADRYAWCCEQFGEDGSRWYLRHVANTDDVGYSTGGVCIDRLATCSFIILKPEDVMVYRLTWSGR